MDALSLLLVIVAIATFFALFYNAKRISDVDRKATSGYATSAPAPTDTSILTDKDGNKVPRGSYFVKVKTWSCAKSTATPPVYTQTVTLAAGNNTAAFAVLVNMLITEFGQAYVYCPPVNKVFKVAYATPAGQPATTPLLGEFLSTTDVELRLIADASAVTVTADTAAAPTCSAGGLFGSAAPPAAGATKNYTLVLLPAEVPTVY